MKYHVYISCEPEILLHPFVSDLSDALNHSGVKVIRSHTNLMTADSYLPRAIERCGVCIIVFTLNYAKSILCFQELEKIMDCRRRRKGQHVVPVFYCLDPSQVCNQSGDFGKVLSDTLERNITVECKALTYRNLLREAATFSPTFLPDIGNHSKVIEDIVAHVTSLLDSTDLFVAEHPVGVNSHVQDLIQVINNHKSDDVLVIAIWGMAGIGKTTIAKALYNNQISRNFDVRKFVQNTNGRFMVSGTTWCLHNDFLSFLRMIIKTNKEPSPNLDLTSLERDNLCNLKLFLVLDNVRNELELMKILSVTQETRECFAPGSIVIITTRINPDRFHPKKDLVNHIYRVKEMDYHECVELFSWTAFSKATPERSFAGLINYAVEYCDGLPLVLVAIGSALSEKGIEEWENVLDSLSLKRFPLQDVWQILKESIESVGYEAKKIFLELAYLSHVLIGMDRNDITQILQDAGLSVVPISKAIKVLEDHSLVWFDEDKFCVHRLLQDIGTEMYMKESSIDPQQRPYDVFLSFRGEDTRSKFLSHLHASLENAGIYVFKDDNGLPRGKNISISLLKAIAESKISITILSPNYASSIWCLQELEDIMRCCKNKSQKVLPVFYHVDPSEVRNQYGKFGQAFDSLMERYPRKVKGKEKSWRKALREVGCLAGLVVRKSSNISYYITSIKQQFLRPTRVPYKSKRDSQR